MTAASPVPWARRTLTAAVTMLLLIGGAATASADPEPGPTTITVEAQLGDDFSVVTTGALTDGVGAPVPDAEVEARLNGETLAKGRTNDDGAYRLTFTVPEAAQSDEQQVVALFKGGEQLDASQAATTLLASQPRKASPADTKEDVFLDVSITPPKVTAGGLVAIEGILTDAQGTPIEGARISVLIDDEESMDSRIQSGDSGSFKTFTQIPTDRPAGATSLVVSFAGDDSHTPGLKQFDVTVQELPTDEGGESAATPTETGESRDSASDDSVSSAPAEPSDDATAATASLSPLSWFYVALIVVGGAALLTAVGLAFRAMYGRHSDASDKDERDLDLLLTPDDEKGEEGAFLSEDFGEIDEDQPLSPVESQEDAPLSSVDPHEIVTPRRGLD